MSGQKLTASDIAAIPLVELTEKIDIIPPEYLPAVLKRLCLLLLYADRCIPFGTTAIPADRRMKADAGVRSSWDVMCRSQGIEMPVGAWAFSSPRPQDECD